MIKKIPTDPCSFFIKDNISKETRIQDENGFLIGMIKEMKSGLFYASRMSRFSFDHYGPFACASDAEAWVRKTPTCRKPALEAEKANQFTTVSETVSWHKFN